MVVVARPLTEEETRRIAETADRYAALKEHYREIAKESA